MVPANFFGKNQEMEFIMDISAQASHQGANESTLTPEAIIKRYSLAREQRRGWESHWRFSCWNENDPNFKKITDVMPGHKVFDTCLRIAKRALAGTLIDPTNGATHYHHENINPPWARAKAPDVHIGKHLFYSNIE